MSGPWPIVRLRDVLTSRTETPSPDDLDTGKVRILGKIAFDTGRLELRIGGETKTAMILIRSGDLVVSGINAAKGAIAVYENGGGEPIAATIHYGAYIPNKDRASVRYLWWLLRSRYFQELLLTHVPGGIKTELKATRLLPIPVPLPPLQKQRQLVSQIEDLASRITEARALRDQTTSQVLALELSVASHLTSSSVWKRLRVRELIGENGLQNGKSVRSSDGGTGIRCLMLSALRDGRIDLQQTKPVPLTEREAAPFLTNVGDVFVVRGNGSKALCGRAGVVTDATDKVIFPDLFIRVSLPPERMLPEFFVAYWNSATNRGVLEEHAKTTSGIWKINQGHIANTVVPVPPLDDQRRALEELNAVTRALDKLVRVQAETAAELDALLPSILDRAFKGELSLG